MTVVAWPTEHVVRSLGLPDGVSIVGMKLSLDGAFVEARVERKSAAAPLVFVDDGVVDGLLLVPTLERAPDESMDDYRIRLAAASVRVADLAAD